MKAINLQTFFSSNFTPMEGKKKKSFLRRKFTQHQPAWMAFDLGGSVGVLALSSACNDGNGGERIYAQHKIVIATRRVPPGRVNLR